jgi:hypothetical protein
MNNHLPYREWIFEEEPLPAESVRELKRHLHQCVECAALADGWTAVRRSMEEAGSKAPRPGFVSRWKAMAAQRLRKPNPRLAWILLAVSSVGSLVMAMALAVETSAQGFSLAGVFNRDLSAAVGTLREWADTSRALNDFLSIVYWSIPPVCYLLAIFFVSLIGILWLLLFVRAGARGDKR